MTEKISYTQATPKNIPYPPSAYTVAQFIYVHHVSRTFFYDLLKKGKGPRLMKVGRRTLISAEAATDWRKRMEDETPAWGADVCTDPSKVVL